MIVTDERAAMFVSSGLGFELCPPYTVMGIETAGQVTAAVVFNCYEGCNIHATAVGKGWGREFLAAVGDYVYHQLGCTRATLTTEQETVARLAERLGGKREGLLRDHFGTGRDGIVIGVLRDEYKFGILRPNS